jgi:hypothetical protein
MSCWRQSIREKLLVLAAKVYLLDWDILVIPTSFEYLGGNGETRAVSTAVELIAYLEQTESKGLW